LFCLLGAQSIGPYSRFVPLRPDLRIIVERILFAIICTVTIKIFALILYNEDFLIATLNGL
jgi:hypothetical protein